MRYTIELPLRNGNPGIESIETTNNIVLVGANGSGKTRLGAWIEANHQERVTLHRISAQKVLSIPDSAVLKNLEQAQADLLYGEGTYMAAGITHAKMHGRWQGNPATNAANDYYLTLSLLFAKSSERDREYTEKAKLNGTYFSVPEAPIDVLTKIWNELLPHRTINFSDGKVTVITQDGDTYHGRDMSDGERIILYLIAQCLCIPDNSIIIIDEPEIHIHKSIIFKLWDSVESVCQNKLLIYITHDLEFATSRSEALKIWIKSYRNNNMWEWDIILKDQTLPENLLFQILGSRKKIIFCEGEYGSFDTIIYQSVYSDFHIIPRGGGDKVIEATKALSSNESLHHLTAYGILDSDYKEDSEKEALLEYGIFILPVAEIENLFCIEPIIRLIAHHQGFEDIDSKVEEVRDFLIRSLTSELDVQITSKAEKIIEYKLGAFSKKSYTKNGLQEGMEETIARINVDSIYTQCEILFKEAIEERDLDKLLLIYNRKSLSDRISTIFNLRSGEYVKLVIRLLKGDKRNEIIQIFKTFLPKIES